MNLTDLVAAVQAHRVHITRHARKEAEADDVELRDVVFSIANGDVITSYQDDKPYPSCLILSWLDEATPIHSVWAYNAASQSAALITVYRPDPEQWRDWKTRIRK